MRTEEQNPLQSIKNRNIDSINLLNEAHKKTVGSRFGRFVSAGFGLIVEYLLYAIALGTFLFIFFMEKVSPFYLLAQMRENQTVQDELNPHIIQNFTFVIQITIGLLACFIFTTAYNLRRVRKNKQLIEKSLVVLTDVSAGLEENNKEIDELDAVSAKLTEAANVVAHESKIDP